MKPLLFSHMRTGLMVLGLFAGLSPAMAAPATIAQPLPLDGPQTAGAGVVNQDNAPMRVAERRGFRPNGGRGGWNRPPGGGGSWNRPPGGGGNWNRPPHGGGGNWHRPPNRGNWNHRPRRYWNNNYWGWGPGYWGGLYGSGIYLQFGQPYYPYGNPGPVYRSDIRLSEAHVQWCYDRWRSYRASDNSYQPYNGPRRLCISPYS